MIKNLIDTETIIAQCTPQGAGALALLRITGDSAFNIANSISQLTSGKQLIHCSSHTIHAGWVVTDQKEKIDYVLFLLMRGPKTFTGQDTVEITCHNNPFLIERIIQEAIKAGARLAQQGEFSKRAFLHDKIDLVQAEAINELIHATNQTALQSSLAQLQGSFSSWIANLERELLKAIAFAEASFEFLDEEADFAPQIKTIVTHNLLAINQIKKSFDQRITIKEGFRICLIGSVNAGKSSLFNALLGKQRAIVTPIAGTTRDVIEASLYHNNVYYTLVDTAGIRQTDDVIEKEGIERSLQEAERADLILLVFDGSHKLTEQEREVYQQLLSKFAQKTMVVQTKNDLPNLINFSCSITAQTAKGDESSIIKLLGIIEERCKNLLSTESCPFLLNKRHYTLLVALEKKLQTMMPLLHGTSAYELISHQLRDALETLSELTGKTINEQSLDTVFREFCVGK